MRRLSKAWTNQENRRLIEAIDAGVSAERVSVMFKRTTTSVRAQALKLGTRFPTILERKRTLKEGEEPVTFSRSVPMKKSYALRKKKCE